MYVHTWMLREREVKISRIDVEDAIRIMETELCLVFNVNENFNGAKYLPIISNKHRKNFRYFTNSTIMSCTFLTNTTDFNLAISDKYLSQTLFRLQSTLPTRTSI